MARNGRTQRAVLKTISVGAMCVAAGLWPAPRAAQGEDGAATQPAADVARELDAKAARDLAERALAKYRALKSYQDTLDLSAEVKAGGDAMRLAMLKSFGTASCSLKWMRPNRFVQTSSLTQTYCDGTNVWSRLDSEYTQASAPRNVLDVLDDDIAAFTPIGVHPLLPLLVEHDAPLERLFPELRFTALREEGASAGAGYVLEGVCALRRPALHSDQAKFTARLGRDLMLREVRVDLTEAARESPLARLPTGWDEEQEDAEKEQDDPTFAIERFEVVLRFRNIERDAELAPSAFVFKPGADCKKVDEFSLYRTMVDEEEEEDQESSSTKLRGRPAPTFSTKTLAGDKVDLAELRGRVVVLDFWATWCRPCTTAIPEVQKLADKYKDKAVTVLGINRDAPDSDELVKDFLAKKDIKFAQIMDAEAELAGKYHVQGIPATFVIDQQGMVRYTHDGYSADLADELAAQIDELLDPGAARAPRASAADDSRPAGAAAEADVAPERLVEGKRAWARFSGYNAARIDVDGDGKPELVSADWDQQLTIVSSDGATVKSLRLKGASRRGSVTAFCFVRSGAGANWFVVHTNHGIGPDSGTTSLVAAYDAEGQYLWSYQPEAPEKTSVDVCIAAGDLDGDGTCEFIVGYQTYSRTKLGPRSYSLEDHMAYVVVLDSGGQVIAKRRVGRQLDYVAVTDAPAGAPCSILCFGDGSMRRFTLAEAKAGDAPADAAPAPGK